MGLFGEVFGIKKERQCAELTQAWSGFRSAVKSTSTTTFEVTYLGDNGGHYHMKDCGGWGYSGWFGVIDSVSDWVIPNQSPEIKYYNRHEDVKTNHNTTLLISNSVYYHS